jgi:hypothetical protein
MQGNGALTRTVDSFDTRKSYRVIFYYAKFDTPLVVNSCVVATLVDNRAIGRIQMAPPRTPNNQFEMAISDTFQPSTSSMSLHIELRCAAGNLNRFVFDDISIEEVV